MSKQPHHTPVIASSPPSKRSKPLRSDGLEARNRLLDAALALFADKGFAKASTRDIAQAAGVNVASISYYFGDKEGLYRAVFEDQRHNPPIEPAQVGLDIDIRTVIEGMLRSFVEPLKSGEKLRQCMKLHFREMLEPTGMWQAEIDQNIKPNHDALAAALMRHLGLSKADDDIHRLAFEIVGMGIMLHVGVDVIQAIRPALIGSSSALDRYHTRLVDYAMALVDAEAACRHIVNRPTSGSKPHTKP